MKTKLQKQPMDMEIMKEMCGTCPFRDDSPVSFLRGDITMSALTECSRICHSTGGNTVLHPKSKTKGKAKLCRGARDIQLRVFHEMGFLEAPTDEAWDKKINELSLRVNMR